MGDPTGTHPYYPVDASIPHYRPNESSHVVFLAAFGGIIFAAVSSVWAIVRLIRPSLRAGDQLCVVWFALCESPQPSHRRLHV
jgi:cholestenol Delta-isomerase